MRALWPRIVENKSGTKEGECEADPIGQRRVWVTAGDRQQQCHRGAERGKLRQREIDEDDAAFNDMYAEIGVDARQDEAGRKRSCEKLDDRQIHGVLSCPAVFLIAMTSRLTS